VFAQSTHADGLQHCSVVIGATMMLPVNYLACCAHSPAALSTQAKEASGQWLWRLFLKLWPPGWFWAGLLAIFNTFVFCIVFTFVGVPMPAALCLAVAIAWGMYRLWPS
jgi:hypothetical protein